MHQFIDIREVIDSGQTTIPRVLRNFSVLSVEEVVGLRKKRLQLTAAVREDQPLGLRC